MAFERFKAHAATRSHMDCNIAWKSAMNVVVSVANQQLSNHSEEVKSNRDNLAIIIDVILLLSKQGLAFRAHRADPSEKNRGNFLEHISVIGNNCYMQKALFCVNNKPYFSTLRKICTIIRAVAKEECFQLHKSGHSK